MLIPFYILIMEGIIPILIKLYLTIIPYSIILLLSELIGLLFITSYVLFFKYDDIKEAYTNINFKIITLLIFISFFGTFLVRILFIKTINDVNNINLFIIIISLYPIITILASYFILNQKLTYKQILGYILVIIGIYFLLYNNLK